MMPNRLIACAALLAAVTLAPLAAAEPLSRSELEERLSRLHGQIGELQERVAVLEALRPSFTAFMPDFSERFHVLHAAGDAGDWAVADHELQELQRLTRLAWVLDAEKGKLLQSMLEDPFHELEQAIQHRSHEAFRAGLSATVASCNACHTATGSAFIQVALDVPEGLTMRHPHKLVPSKPLTKHTHAH